MKASIEVTPDAKWADRVTERLLAEIAPGKRLCLPTGSTPVPVYRRLAGSTSLEGLELFLLDEFGGLPKGDPGRCATMLSRELLSVSTGSANVHIPDVDAADPAEAASRFGALIHEGGLDLAVVGLGPNGHIGLNEPGSTPDQTTRVVDLAPLTSQGARLYGATATPTWGITVGMAELAAAREVLVLVTGGHKAEILQRVLDGPIGPETPASYLTDLDSCTFLVDESAALNGAV